MTRVVKNLGDLSEESVEELFKAWRIYSMATLDD